MTLQMWIALAVFVAAFVLISTERIHRALASLTGAVIFIVIQIIESKQAFHDIDWGVIFLLVSMMLLVSLTKRTGIFQFVAIKAAKIAKGNPVSILVFMSIITALSSALLGTVTTVLILSPVTILIAVELGISAIPFLIAQAIAANLGGMTTLIGDPTSVLIGSAARFSFLDFVSNNGVAVIPVMAAFLLLFTLFFRRQMRVSNERKARIMDFDESRSIQDKKLLIKCSIVIGLVILGFIFGSILQIEPAVVAISGATLLLLISERHEIDKLLVEVEWGTILFFIGLFIMVAGIENLGIIDQLAKALIGLTGGDLMMTAILILWASGFISAFVDNIPYVIAMIPLIQSLGTTYGSEAVVPLWWALSLGAVFGGNATLIGASANVVTAGISGKNGHPISFMTFTRYGAPVAFVAMGIGTVYLLLRYFVLKI